MSSELNKLISELHKIQEEIDSVEIEMDRKDKLIILDPKIEGLCHMDGHYINLKVKDPTTTPHYIGDYQQQYDRWYRSHLKHDDKKRLTVLKGQEYQIRRLIWDKTGSWKQFDKEYYCSE